MPGLGCAFLPGRSSDFHLVNLPHISLIRYCGTPEEAARSVEEVLDYVPGECWAQLLPSPCAATLVMELLRVEILGLPRPLYSQVCIYFGCFPFHCSIQLLLELWSRTWLLLSSDRGLCAARPCQLPPSQEPTLTSSFHHCQGFSPPCIHHLSPGREPWPPSSPLGLDLPGLVARVCNAQVGL